MEELQIPTHMVAVELHTDDGERLSGRLYLLESRYGGDRLLEVLAVLNDERAFLPFEAHTREGHVHRALVYNKDHIVRVRMTDTAGPQAGAAPAPGEDSPRDEPIPVVVLADGTRICGRVAVETPWSSSRLVDKLNHAQRFIPLITDGGVDFVQKAHVLRVD